MVKMRLPSFTTPEPVDSCGDCLAQGLKVSGRREVANTFTTELVMAPVAVIVAGARPPAGSGVVTAEVCACSAGADKVKAMSKFVEAIESFTSRLSYLKT